MLKKKEVERIIKREARIIHHNLQEARRLSVIRNEDFDYLIDELLFAVVDGDCKSITNVSITQAS